MTVAEYSTSAVASAEQSHTGGTYNVVATNALNLSNGQVYYIDVGYGDLEVKASNSSASVDGWVEIVATNPDTGSTLGKWSFQAFANFAGTSYQTQTKRGSFGVYLPGSPEVDFTVRLYSYEQYGYTYYTRNAHSIITGRRVL